VPVVDLRKKFSMGEAPEDESAVVIVVMVRSKIVGLLVDAVSDVLSIPLESIQPAPELTRGLDNDFLAGIGQHGDRLVTFLEIDQVLNEELATA
jgi:purine-binding chemotaxis protein CheW